MSSVNVVQQNKHYRSSKPGISRLLRSIDGYKQNSHYLSIHKDLLIKMISCTLMSGYFSKLGG